jgi:moderate conductance mechanosensitive channel
LLLLRSTPGLLERLEAVFRVDAAAVLRGASQLIAIWVLAWIALRLVRLASQRMEDAVNDHDAVLSRREQRGKTISQLLRSAGRIVVLTIGILLSLNVFIDIGPLLGGAAVVGLAISFGAQSLFKDLIAGFFMLVEDQFALGDVVEAAGKGGVVEKITLRVVVLRDLDGTLHTIPNGEMKTVSNKTRGWSRAVVDVAIAYAEDVDHAIEVIRDEAERLTHDEEWASLLDGVPEVWGVESLSDSAAVVRVVAKTQPGSHWGVQREYRRRIKKRLEEAGIKTPAPRGQVNVQVEPAAAR